MNFYDILAAEKVGGGVPTMNFFDLLFAQYMGGGEQWETYEGTLPAMLYANATNMRQYQIWGNVGGVGDVTETGEPAGYKIPIATEKPIIYGFHINPNDPNSYTAVTYLADAVGKTPAAMGSTAFSYGDWANAFFMPRPCMLKYDGTVDYYLNPNDYSLKADGTASDYNNLAYGGNAMMEFPLIWYKFVQGTESGEGYFYCSNRKVDDSYKCFSNLDCDGNIIEHFYMPIYNGCTYDGKMRSISGLQLSPWSTTAYSSSSTYAVGSKVNYNGRMWKCTTAVEAAEAFDPAKWEQFAFNGQTSGTEEITQATANNTTSKVEWHIDALCDRQLINALLVLLSKSLDTQGSFGRGVDDGGQAAKEAYVTGSLNDKGLFYGSTANGNTAVKVFGMENWWACAWHRTAGLIGAADNIYKYKMTYSTADGSTANGYNTDGTGYLSIGNKPATNYIKKMQYGLWGCLPIETGSNSAQYFRDYWYNGTGYALFGGTAARGALDGAFCANLTAGVGGRAWHISSDLSCKPYSAGDLSKNLEATTVTPIYIGSDPLGKDEYIDYQAGKVYRKKAVHEDTVTINGIVWDILGYDCDTAYKDDNTLAQHTVTIQTHESLSSMLFDAREALFAFDNGLSAGTYFFTVGSQPWYSADINKNIQFTLANDIPRGGQLVINNANNATMINATISAYANSTAITASETVTMIEGNSGLNLGTVDAALSDNGICNSIERAFLGSNRWSQSAIRQYLNSSSNVGGVWTPQTKWDRPPSWVSNTAGFLHSFDNDFMTVLGTAKKTTVLNAITDVGRTETTDDRVFLLSGTEAYAGNERDIAEGTPYPYYSDFSSLSQAGTDSDSNRKKILTNVSDFEVYWLRTPQRGTARTTRAIGKNGEETQSGSTNLKGISPACTIILDDIVSNDWLKNIFLQSETTPIYIGNEPLGKGEYIDYQAGKVYRMINGTLTPTDPPVPLPALPTCQGATVVDYAGSGTEPEKVYFEYQGGKQP